VGESDCEALDGGFLAQDVNALTALAFLAAGAWVVLRARRLPPGRRGWVAAFGVAVAANGIGSFLFHGPQPAGAGWVHDVAIAGVVLFVAVYDTGCLRRWSAAATAAGYAAALVTAGAALAWLPGGGGIVAVTAGAALIAAEVAFLARRPVEAHSRVGPRAAAYAATLVVLAAAALGDLAGGTGGPWCVPGSVLQWHALWHLGAAAGLAGFAYAVLEIRTAPGEERLAQAS